MAGLDRKVLNSRRITKLVAPSNPVFSRSFITSFGVASYNQGAGCWPHNSIPLLFSSKNQGTVLSFPGKGVHLHRKTNNNIRENESLFI